ncbi:MAG: hypothetical protein AAF805_01130 [Planctomycetota bacterium]
MANQKMGFEGQLLYGPAGSTGQTLLENSRDITLTYSQEKGDTTVRGDGTAPPTGTELVTKIMVGVEFQMVNDSTDTALEALKVAATNGAPVALRGRDYAAGKGPDADFILEGPSAPWPLNGEQVVTFTASPTRSEGRNPQKYV